MQKIKLGKTISILITILVKLNLSWAAPLPNAGTLLREIEQATGKQDLAPAPLIPLERPPAEAPLPEKAGQTVLVTGFKIKATIFSENELIALLKDYIGKKLTLAELQAATRKISDYYARHDYLAHAYLPPQTVRDGIVEIVVVESRLGQIKIDPSSVTRLKQNFATKLLGFRAGLGDWLRPSRLSEGMEILNETPGIRATSTLAPGAVENESAAILKIEDTALLNGSLTLDRGGSRSTGAKRALFNAALNNNLGFGDQFALVGLKSVGTVYARLAANQPVGFSGLNLGINSSALNYKVGGALTALDIHGYAVTIGLTAAYPIKRSNNFSLTANATVDHKHMVDIGNNVTLSDKNIEVGTLGLSTMIKDGWLTGGTNRLGITVTIGKLDLSKQQEKFNADQATAQTNGFFTKLMLTATREQPLINNLMIVDNFRSQLALLNLDGSEQFSLGGQDGIRAYPVSEGAGDVGWMNTLELRWQINQKFQLISFYDIGQIYLHKRPWNNWRTVPGQVNDYLLQGAGFGITWSPLNNLQIKATLAHTISNNPGHDANGNDSDGTPDKMRNWLQAIINF